MASSPADPETILQGKDLQAIIRLWEEKYQQPGYDPEPVIKRLCEIFEEETDTYMRKDPDPFDERHPSRTDPECGLGRSLKALFRKDNFMTRLVNDYLRDNYFTRQNIQKSSLELNITAIRLILVIMPGLDTSAVFEDEALINRLYNWAEKSAEPLQSYATGLLGAAMDVQEIASSYRDQNLKLVPIMLKRLHFLQSVYKNKLGPCSATNLPMELGKADTRLENTESNPAILDTQKIEHTPSVERPFAHLGGGSAPGSPEQAKVNNGSMMNGLAKFCNTTNLTTLIENETSQGPIDYKYIRTNYIPIHPPTMATSQMLILRYLSSMGDYQEFLGQVFEHDALQLIFRYVENLDPKDTCLAFESLKYLASLLCHKKFALEFTARGGLELLLKVPRPGIAATGVSITLYYLAYCEDAMERICAMPIDIVKQMVKYALWLLGCSHESGKCHATMFFGLSFQFKIILDEFDSQDGLRLLYNTISILPVLSQEDVVISDDEECAERQLVRHVCVAMKKYMESHLYFKYTHFARQQCPSSDMPTFKAAKLSPEQISEHIRNLQENLPFRHHWQPVDDFLRLGGVQLLLRIISYCYDWNNNGRGEMVRSALDVLSVCCIIPKTYTVFCERMTLPDNSHSAGINPILAAAVGEIAADADVQKSALAVLVHCVCAPMTRPLSNRFGSAKKKINSKFTEEIIEKVWESVCSNNGIIVLLQLMQVKAPITDADCIRGMACRALAGLARSERVCQIIGKLPLFANGLIQHLMRDPILQEKRAEHVIFQKYALELLERISGRVKSVNGQMDVSLANIRKANVVAQTKIQFNEQQLNQLIFEHLASRGFHDSAAALMREANLHNVSHPTSKTLLHHSPFNYRALPACNIPRSRIRTRTQELNVAFQSACSNESATSPQVVNGNNPTPEHVTSSNTPIKLIKKTSQTSTICSSTNISNHSSLQKSLQKQVSYTEPISHRTNSISEGSSGNNVTLTTIVTEYLANQHALCNNPMSTCPQFDLYVPHKCPDPKPNKVIGYNRNITARVFYAQAGYDTSRLDRWFVHSQFCSTRMIRPQDYSEVQFTCCDLIPNSNNVLVGTFHGEAKVFNVTESSEEFSSQCHNSFVDNVKVNRAGDLAITSCLWRQPSSILWSIDNKEFWNKLQFDDEFYCEFSNVNQDKILGTKTEGCTIYDLHTGQKISTFTPTLSNQYTKNRATFCPTDELILSDGVLWDVRSGKEIHKFDKLNQILSGVFHPNGLEIISNTEVWDLRTFHLLRTVPVLDQCIIKFSPLNVIYGISLDVETRDDSEIANMYDSSFKVLDSFDYSSISTIDVKRNIFDLSISENGSNIALIESQGMVGGVQETCVRLYSVGVRKNDEHNEDEEDELETDENSMSDSDSTGSRAVRIDFPRRHRRRNRRRRGNNANNGNNSGSEEIDFELQSFGSSSDNDDDDEEEDDNEGSGGSNGDENDGDNDSWTTTSDVDIVFDFS